MKDYGKSEIRLIPIKPEISKEYIEKIIREELQPNIECISMDDRNKDISTTYFGGPNRI